MERKGLDWIGLDWNGFFIFKNGEMKMDGINYDPLDVARLTKGTVIQVEEIENITGYKRMHRLYPLQLLKLRNKCNRELRKRGIVLTLRCHKGNLVVCDDSEASRYNRKQGRSGMRRFARSHYRNLAVDATALESTERKQHDNTLLVNGRILSAMRTETRRSLSASKAERRTPLLTQNAAATPNQCQGEK